jgi:hypothetical protein
MNYSITDLQSIYFGEKENSESKAAKADTIY